jgi:hypothetical protein
MVRIAQNKLIIEIATQNQEPMALLADLQKGIIDLMFIIPFSEESLPEERLGNGMYSITRLLGEMIFSPDQASCLNRNLNKEQILEINKWVR